MPAWILPAAMAVGSLIGNLFSQSRQNKKNREMAQFQADANQQSLDKQLDYNTPANQMSRFQDAGLNPNLIYGQGNPGNQSEPLKYPDIGRVDYGGNIEKAMQGYNQTALTQSQVQATDARTRQTAVLTQLNKLQADVMAKNPLLNNDAYQAVIQGLISTAEIKASESGIKLMDKFYAEAVRGTQADKVFREVELLEQRFKLGQLDSKIKAEVLISKEFQNAILEIQKKFMTDGEITPQHILQFVMLLLQKSL